MTKCIAIFGILVVFAFLNLSCGSLQMRSEVPSKPLIEKPIPSATPLPNPLEEEDEALAWNHPSWSKHLKNLVIQDLSKLEKAKDIKRFCPMYSNISQTNKIRMWANLIVAMTKFESSYNPKSTYQEAPPPAGPGTLSIGLLQMSYGDKHGDCPLKKSEGDLMDPLVNLSCGVKIFSYWVSTDGVIQNSANRGAARYWSVLRDGHHVDEIARLSMKSQGCI